MPVYLATDDDNRNFVVGGGARRGLAIIKLRVIYRMWRVRRASERRRISLAAEYQVRDRRGNLRLAFFFFTFSLPLPLLLSCSLSPFPSIPTFRPRRDRRAGIINRVCKSARNNELRIRFTRSERAVPRRASFNFKRALIGFSVPHRSPRRVSRR